MKPFGLSSNALARALKVDRARGQRRLGLALPRQLHIAPPALADFARHRFPAQRLERIGVAMQDRLNRRRTDDVAGA